MRAPDSYYKEVADELNLPLALVKRVNNYYWREGIKNNMSNVNFSSIFIKNLGTIVISKYKLHKEILHVIKKIRRIQESEKYTEAKKEFVIERYKINLRRLLKKRNDIIKENYFENGYNY
jgi:hypothetical protein